MLPKLQLEIIQLWPSQQNVLVLIISKPLHDLIKPVLRTVSNNKQL